MSRPQKSESEEEFASAPEDNDDGDSNVPGEKSRQDKSKKPVDVNNDEMTTKGKGKEVSTGNEVAESEPAATVREINEILNEMSADSENLLQEKTEDEQTDRTRNIDKQGDRNEEKSRETVDNEEVVAVESTYGQETEAVTAGNIRDALISSTGDIRESGEPQSSAHFTGDIKDALRAVTDKKASKPASSGWGWGGWLSSTASALGQGLQSAIHTVEETLGIPEPEEIAKHTQNDDTAEEGKKEIVDSEPQKSKTGTTETVKTTDVEEESSSTFSMWSGMSALSSVIASKSSELVSGGIDALEAIGRKTMDVISDGDPGLRQKRAAIQELTSGPAVVLSKLLRDAKQQAEENQNSNAETGIHFSTLFDEYQGFVHLEALELLSTECSSKLQSAQVAIEDDEVMKQLQDIKEAFQLKNDDEEEDVKDQTVEITSFLLLQFEKLKIQYKAQKLEKDHAHHWLMKTASR
ncbi:protein FAM114A2-like isoform X2 [Corticium candelabrum]|uniref:protein FAM114A2-like isoform X2 n=1 Tax=Corticium candelabrum TaxID=121492 RepID=UPI002E262AE1|nr:protein FAM114A2-like isoform X2 [Corticium candelabrum]